MKKSSGTLYWYGVGASVLAETDASGNTTNEYIFFAGGKARRDGSGNVYYYFADQIGSSRTITNSTGSLCYDADFYPWGGERTPYVNTCAQNYKFAGMERDPETGNDHTMFRQYASNLGRWASPDPLAGDITNPQSLNRYAYVMNNPTTLTDPMGLDSIGVDPCGKNPHKAVCGGDAASSEAACMQAGLTPNCSGPMGSGELESAEASWQSALDISFLSQSNLDKQASWTLGGTTYTWVTPQVSTTIEGSGTTTYTNQNGYWSAAKDFLKSLPLAGAVNIPIPVVTPEGVVPGPGGPSIPFALNVPSTKAGCVGGGWWLGTPGAKTVGGGPVGGFGNTKDVLSGWSWSVNYQDPFYGFQIIWNESGVLGGPTWGLNPGIAVSRTWSKCG